MLSSKPRAFLLEETRAHNENILMHIYMARFYFSMHERLNEIGLREEKMIQYRGDKFGWESGMWLVLRKAPCSVWKIHLIHLFSLPEDNEYLRHSSYRMGGHSVYIVYVCLNNGLRAVPVPNWAEGRTGKKWQAQERGQASSCQNKNFSLGQVYTWI